MAGPPQTIKLAELAAKAKAEARLGTIVSDRYRLTEVLAMGGVGVVYKGEHVHMRKKVAIKLLHPDAESAPDLVARFQREAVAGAHIQHPNVAAATDFGELPDESFFLVLEYVRGTTLREIIARGPLGARRSVHIAKQIAAALAATHAIGIVHRDVTPRNIMVVEGERDLVKLIDFGLAKLDATGLAKADAIHHSDHDIRITGTGAVFGTIAYLAPEVVRGMDLIDARFDLYALGIVMYEMLSGKHPFSTTDAVELFKHHAGTRPPPIAERAPGVVVPPALEAIVMRLLEKAPEARYPSAEALIAALETDLEGALTPSTPPPVTTGEGEAARPSLAPPRPSVPPPPRLSAPPPAPSAPRWSTPPPAPAPAAASPLPGAIPRSIPPPPIPSAPPPAMPAPIPSAPPPAIAAPRPMALSLGEPDPFARSRRRKNLMAAAVLGAIALGAVGLLWASHADLDASASSGADSASPSSTAPSSAAAPVIAAPTAIATAAPTAAQVADGPPDQASRDLFRTTVHAKSYLPAVAPFRALVEHDRAAFRDPTIAAAARDLASVLATHPGPDTDFIYDALANRLGAEGVDVLYEITRLRGGSRAATRAGDMLKRPEVLGRASPAVKVTYEYTNALCPQKLTLLDRAQKEGDYRTLMALEASAKTCFPQSQPLDDAIKALRQRVGSHPPP
ncbi:MAG: serine/threonine-protein kinase [Byssovorax sp.]